MNILLSLVVLAVYVALVVAPVWLSIKRLRAGAPASRIGASYHRYLREVRDAENDTGSEATNEAAAMVEPVMADSSQAA